MLEMHDYHYIEVYISNDQTSDKKMATPDMTLELIFPLFGSLSLASSYSLVLVVNNGNSPNYSGG